MYKFLPYLLLLLIPSIANASQNQPQFYVELNFFEAEGDFQEFVQQNAADLIQKYNNSNNENLAYLFSKSIQELDEGKWSETSPPTYTGQQLIYKVIASPRLLVRKDASFQLESGFNNDKKDKSSLYDKQIIGYELNGEVTNLDEINLIREFHVLVDKITTKSSDLHVSEKIKFVMNELQLQNNKPYTLLMQINNSTFCAIEISVEMLENGASPTINPN